MRGAVQQGHAAVGVNENAGLRGACGLARGKQCDAGMATKRYPRRKELGARRPWQPLVSSCPGERSCDVRCPDGIRGLTQAEVDAFEEARIDARMAETARCQPTVS